MWILELARNPLGYLAGLIPEWAWGLITIGSWLIVIGFAWTVGRWVYRFAGWLGVGGWLIIAGTLFAVLWPKRKMLGEALEHVDGPDAAPAPKRPPGASTGIPRGRKRKTLVEVLAERTGR